MAQTLEANAPAPMPPTSVTVRVPATSANLGPGFDCLGLALDLWGSVTLSREGGRTGRGGSMDRMILGAAHRLYERYGREAPNLTVRYDSTIPIARGLGASAVARVGALLAANALEGEPFDREEMLALAADLEGHADNAAPALFGGLQVVVRDGDRILHTAVPLAGDLKAILFVPELLMPTGRSRELLPQTVSRADAVYNLSRAALLVAALSRGRLDLLDVATEDRLHQPARSQLFPAMYAIFEAALAAGAHCAYLSGGGSTICALASANERAIAEAMAEAARSREVTGQTIITTPTERGAEVREGS
ncbi:MAG: homoserine kinase [Dehalococcoidia bacterium]